MKVSLLSIVQNIIILYNVSPLTKSFISLGGPQGFIIKIIASCKIAIAFSIPAFIIEKASNWTITNSSYIAGVLICIAIDHITGTIYHAFKRRDFSFKKNATGLVSKLSLCAFAAILFEVIHFTVKDVAFAFEYLKTITRLVIILYPAGSAFTNMSALTNGVFPPTGWIKRIKSFNENLEIDKIKNPE